MFSIRVLMALIILFLQQFTTARLVNEHGIINPEGFYNYLTVWYNYDTWSYSASQAMLHPNPTIWTPGDKTDKDIKSEYIRESSSDNSSTD